MIGCYLQTVDQRLQWSDGSQCFAVIFRHVSQVGDRLAVVSDGLLDGGVDAGKTLDGSVGQNLAVIDLLVETCRGRRGGVTLSPEFIEKTNSVSSSVRVSTVSTSQGVQGDVQLVGVEAFQSALGVALGDVDSVKQLVELLQRGTTSDITQRNKTTICTANMKCFLFLVTNQSTEKEIHLHVVMM